MIFPPEKVLRKIADELPSVVADEVALPSYLHPNPLLRYVARRRVELLAEMMLKRLHGGSNVLDFGCGCGVLFTALSPACARIYGVDIHTEPAAMLIGNCGLAGVTLLTPERIAEIPDGSIDVAVCGEVLEHFDDPSEILAVFRRKLKPEGRLFVTMPTENFVYKFGRLLSGFSGEYHRINAAAIDARIRSCGFRALAHKSFPLPGPLSVYWLKEYCMDKRNG
jgi:ubiquinone/menaquinone biosynthesis C-methylase UbiE